MSDVNNLHDIGTLLNVICPMHAVVDHTGHIVHAGASTHKLFASGDALGARFLEAFELKRPRAATTMKDLRAMAGVKLHLKLRAAPRTELKGILVPLGKDTTFGPPGGAIINLSFGISVLDAVNDFSLTSADFAATDLAVEMLYLVEAKSAAMEASRKLNLRLQGAKVAAEEQAFTDTLTGLRNRRAMDHVLNRMMETEQDFALMNLDLDYFKAVNDNMGHAAGDYVLQRVAQIMVNETRSEDTIVRTGGDEFVLIFAGLTNRPRVSEIADRLIARLEEPIDFNAQTCRISASIGATLSCDYKMPALEQMMDDADVALYAAKDRGRGQHVLFDASLRGGDRVVAMPGR
ncbi:GGDEF domain-containing protein [uncultured Roseovarius sp.]|uniref:GGDEF domain-containing protein n=1 Tax=uncultured Roseovarius sp. TaxID=293344 RepID=UPI00261C8177|nr:GGDEF domain-containing protein [uncultured Roseovarius sp.]